MGWDAWDGAWGLEWNWSGNSLVAATGRNVYGCFFSVAARAHVCRTAGLFPGRHEQMLGSLTLSLEASLSALLLGLLSFRGPMRQHSPRPCHVCNVWGELGGAMHLSQPLPSQHQLAWKFHWAAGMFWCPAPSTSNFNKLGIRAKNEMFTMTFLPLFSDLFFSCPPYKSVLPW